MDWRATFAVSSTTGKAPLRHASIIPRRMPTSISRSARESRTSFVWWAKLKREKSPSVRTAKAQIYIFNYNFSSLSAHVIWKNGFLLFACGRSEIEKKSCLWRWRGKVSRSIIFWFWSLFWLSGDESSGVMCRASARYVNNAATREAAIEKTLEWLSGPKNECSLHNHSNEPFLHNWIFFTAASTGK